MLTATGPDGPVGLTASSFSSVSLDPPLISVCVDAKGASHAGVTTADGFAVHVLDDTQEALSNRFARPSNDRFGPNDWHPGRFAAPLLPLGLSRIICARHQIVDAGDHTIIIGRVIEVETSQGKPLLYWAGKYRALAFND